MDKALADLDKKDRRSAVWAVCGHLGTLGVKPTVREVRRFYTRGSDTDVQGDINEWWAALWQDYRDRYTLPGMPTSVVEAADALWKLALAEAARTAEEAREDAQNQVAAAIEEVAAVRAEAAAARQQTQETARRLELSVQECAQLRERILDLESRLANETGQRQSAESRLADMREEAARKEAEHQAQIQSMSQEAARNQEQWEGMRAHLMQQTDEMRQRHREELDARRREVEDLKIRENAYRQQAGKAQEEVFRLQGKLEQAAEDAKALGGRLDALQGQLSAEQASNAAAQAEARLLRQRLEGLANALPFDPKNPSVPKHAMVWARVRLFEKHQPKGLHPDGEMRWHEGFRSGSKWHDEAGHELAGVTHYRPIQDGLE